jgi:cupin 2 domain-containing protein
MRSGNLFSNIPERVREEMFETVVGSEQVRIERIVSDDHASPQGCWFDQNENEWVLLLQGSAGLRFEGEDEILVLNRGDWIEIPAHVKHRVEWTDPKEKTLWLAVFY